MPRQPNTGSLLTLPRMARCPTPHNSHCLGTGEIILLVFMIFLSEILTEMPQITAVVSGTIAYGAAALFRVRARLFRLHTQI